MKNLIIIIALIFCSSVPAIAQEIQVPIDNENKVLVVDKEMESKLAIFTEYKGFVDAKLFKSDDGTYVLEVTYKIDSKIHRKRSILSQKEVDELRLRVTDCIQSECPVVLLDQSGRTGLIIGTTVLGLGYYGWAVPAYIEVKSGGAAIGLYSIVSATSFFAPYLITDDIQVTEATSELAVYGGAAGIAHGIFLYMSVVGDSEFTSNILAVGMLTSIAELTAGYQIATRTNMSVGKAEVIASVGTFGAFAGLGTQVLIDIDGGPRGYGISGLLGSALGLAAGNVVANGQSFSKGDAYVFSTAGLLGGYIPFALYMASIDENDIFDNIDNLEDKVKTLTGITVAGSILGLVAGNYLVKELDFTPSQGKYTAWGTTLGGLFGLGIGYMIDEDDSVPMLLGSAIGASASFGLLYNAFKKDARNLSALDGLDVNISPVGIAAMFNNVDYGLINERPVVSPILDISFKW